MTTIGVLHPGHMGAAIAAALVEAGHEVGWAADGRSVSTRNRAEQAGLKSYEAISELAANSEVIISICPPDAAIAVACEVSGFTGLYVDANAISPASASEVARIASDSGATYVDGGVIGQPPVSRGDMRLYLSGTEAAAIAELFAGTVVDARVISTAPTDASALKMAYAAWTKGSAALLLAVADAANELGVADALIEEWETSQPHLPD